VAPPPAMPAIANPSTVAAGQASVELTITGTSLAGSEFFDPGPDTGGPGFVNRISASINGGVTVNSVTFVSPIQLVVNISTVGASTGAKDVTITNPDGQSLTGDGLLTVLSPIVSLAFNGKLRDRVGQGEPGMSPDGALDGTFAVTLGMGSGARTVTALDLISRRGGHWDTIPANGVWGLAAAGGLDTTLLNSSTGTVNFPVADGGSFVLFASDSNNSLFSPGTAFTLTVNFADGSSSTASVTVP